MAKTYDPNVDYMKKMEEAAAKGDYEQAAYYEEKRNEKIKGEGLSQYSLSHKYEAYLPVTTEKKMKEIFQKLESREPFSYDVEGDKLYSQYKDHYTKAGSLAREDAIAQGSALTGGYGNSYAMTLGQEAYDNQLERLEDLIPDLYKSAKDAYDAEGDALLDQYEALAKELEREQDAALAQEKLDYEKELNAQKLQQEQANAAEKAQKEAKEQAYSLAMSMLKEGLMPTQEVLKASGISQADALTLAGGKSSGTTSGSKTTGTKTTGTKTETEKTKDLTNAMWEKLRTSYQDGSRKENLTDFYRIRSMMEAQGYNVAAFDTWARQTYGKDYTSGKEKTVDYQSVLDLGYGPIGADRIQELLNLGVIEQYTQGDYIYYKKAKTPPALPIGYGT